MTFWRERSSAKWTSPRKTRRAFRVSTIRMPSGLCRRRVFRVARQGKHLVMTDGIRIITIPRHNPVNAFTMGGIVRDAGLSEEEFRALL